MGSKPSETQKSDYLQHREIKLKPPSWSSALHYFRCIKMKLSDLFLCSCLTEDTATSVFQAGQLGKKWCTVMLLQWNISWPKSIKSIITFSSTLWFSCTSCSSYLERNFMQCTIVFSFWYSLFERTAVAQETQSTSILCHWDLIGSKCAFLSSLGSW